MIPLSEFARLRQDPDGTWRPFSTRLNSISYPADGNAKCFETEESSYWFKHRNDVIAEILRQAAVSPAWMLDIGGGNGVVSACLRDKGFKMAVLEPGHVGVKNAHARGIQDVIESTFEEAQFFDQAVPAAGMFDVLEHFERDENLLREIRKCLRPDGFIVIAVPAHGFLWSRSDQDAGHFRRYSRASLTRTLEAAGFKVKRASYFFAPLLVPVLIFRTLENWIRKSNPTSREADHHGTSGGCLVSMMKFALRLEFRALRIFGKIPFGASLIAIAVPKDDVPNSAESLRKMTTFWSSSKKLG